MRFIIDRATCTRNEAPRQGGGTSRYVDFIEGPLTHSYQLPPDLAAKAIVGKDYVLSGLVTVRQFRDTAQTSFLITAIDPYNEPKR